jgi:hypothetical protein
MTDSTPNPDLTFARWLTSRRKPLLALAFLFAAFWTLLYLQFTVDDAFISFRYGRTLLQSHTWNWNPSGTYGEATHEEAYTSFTYALLGIVPALIHISAPLFFKLFGLACLGWIAYRLQTLASPFAALLGILLLAIHPFVWIHAFSGLETPLYILLIVEMALCVKHADTVPPTWVYALFLLLPLTRPEGIVFACAGVLLFWRNRATAPKQIAWFAAAILAGLTYFLARWRYFHHLLPNPYYAKVPAASWRTLLHGLADNASNFAEYFFILLLLFFIARTSTTRVFAVCSFFLLLLLFAPNNMPMNYADRFYLQLTLPIFLVFLLVESTEHASRIAAILAGIFLLAISAGALRYAATYFPGLQRAHADLGRRIAPFAPDHVLFTGEVGAIPYYSGWVTWDFYGLGTHGSSPRTVTLTQLQQLHPDLLLLFATTPGPKGIEDTNMSGGLAVNPIVSQFLRQTGEYEYVASSHGDGFYIVSFLRRDTARYDEIRTALKQNSDASEAANLTLKSLLLQQYVPWAP